MSRNPIRPLNERELTSWGARERRRNAGKVRRLESARRVGRNYRRYNQAFLGDIDGDTITVPDDSEYVPVDPNDWPP